MHKVSVLLFGLISFFPMAISQAGFEGICGDVNNNGVVNILDITYLISYLYKSGFPPECGLETGTMRDIDGNLYKTVKIGNKWWMAENLKVTHYRNGEVIPRVTDTWYWSGTIEGAYCEYWNMPELVPTYGRLYNWYTVVDFRGLAPEGWHIPNGAEWQTMVDFLGGDSIAGGKLKEAGTLHWLTPNAGATNESGFTGLPGGLRDMYGAYNLVSNFGYFWTLWDLNDDMAYFRALYYSLAGCYQDVRHKRSGFSVRCVKD
ncbi:MAG: FISUMP domain-containing protein [Candidatus Zixiibacteriota bacterium]